jgi:SAM-dependent methyltransferase
LTNEEYSKTNTLTLRILEKADAYHRWIYQNISPHIGEDVLEIGCGIGNMTGLLLGRRRVIASDVNKRYLRIVEGRYRGHPNLKGILRWDIRQSTPKGIDPSIDTIVCLNVLEHIEGDGQALKNFFNLLPAKGRLIVLVPALKPLYNSFDRELGHFRRYSKKELTGKILANGFQVTALRYFNFFGLFGWFVNGTLLRRRLLPARQVKMFDHLVPLFMKVEKIIPPLAGQSLIVIGEKARTVRNKRRLI